ncbi:MAG: hypothetical protein WCC17_10385 [Candidatus Nitrosopolaris sp.]
MSRYFDTWSINADKLTGLTDGYTGADIAAIVNAAAMTAIKDQISCERSLHYFRERSLHIFGTSFQRGFVIV